jgi:hypothetical protein
MNTIYACYPRVWKGRVMADEGVKDSARVVEAIPYRGETQLPERGARELV